MTFSIHFGDLPHSDRLRSECERVAEELRSEFPEALKVEVKLHKSGENHEAHLHVTGKSVDVAATSSHRGLHESVSECFERARRQLRKHHDKVVFERRRRA